MDQRGNPKFRKVKIISVSCLVFIFMLFMVFTQATFEPFKTAREYFVGTAMTTASLRDFVRFIISKDEISRIMKIGNPYVKETTSVMSLDVKPQKLDVFAKSTPSPNRKLKITLLSDELVLKIEKIEKKNYGSGYYYITEDIKHVQAKVKASERYDYQYLNPKRYLVEKGMDEFFVDVVQVKSQFFKGNLIMVSDPSKISVGVSSKVGVLGEAIESILKENKAIGGINAGGFDDAGWSGNGGTPSGLLISNGKEISHKLSKSICGFTKNNKFVVGYYSSANIKKLDLRDAVEFGPPLIVNGTPTFSSGTNAATGIHPRTAIGQRKNGAVIFLTIDGRQVESIGASLYDIQNIFLENGAINACNLDGGHSSFMMFNKKMISVPYQGNPEKPIPSTFMIVP